MQTDMFGYNPIKKDIVYTPEWVAKDMVDHFQPSGRILDPCKGQGVFLKYMPSADWCEILEGRDFFDWRDPVDWIVGNPPYSLFARWMYHSFEIAQNIVYLIPLDKPFISAKMIRRMTEWGRIKSMRFYGQGKLLNFPIGFAVGAVHFQKGYHGPMYLTCYGNQ